MKPSNFEYFAPDNINEAISILDQNSEARILAGGQSLVPSMNFRLTSPSHLIDLKNIENLDKITIENNQIKVGALVTHSELEFYPEIENLNPLIFNAMKYVAHTPIRNRGTTVGSICHADAAAEMPLILLMTDGYVLANGPSGSREVLASDLFQFHMTTSLNQNEVVTQAVFGCISSNKGTSFKEFARRHGDYAIAAVSVIIDFNDDETIKDVRLGSCGIASKPVRLKECEQVMLGNKLSQETLDKVKELSSNYVTAEDDFHATNSYRKHLLSNLLKEALLEAKDDCLGK